MSLIIELLLTSVLRSAGIGLIFMRSHEGTQPGGLTQTGQSKALFNTLWHRAPVWVGELAGGRWITAQEHAGHRVVREFSEYSLDFLYILTSIIVVSVHFLCYSVKLSLSWPMSFAFFFPFFSLHKWGEGQ